MYKHHWTVKLLYPFWRRWLLSLTDEHTLLWNVEINSRRTVKNQVETLQRVALKINSHSETSPLWGKPQRHLSTKASTASSFFVMKQTLNCPATGAIVMFEALKEKTCRPTIRFWKLRGGSIMSVHKIATQGGKVCGCIAGSILTDIIQESLRLVTNYFQLNNEPPPSLTYKVTSGQNGPTVAVTFTELSWVEIGKNWKSRCIQKLCFTFSVKR